MRKSPLSGRISTSSRKLSLASASTRVMPNGCPWPRGGPGPFFAAGAPLILRERATWNIAARLGKEVEDAYWRVCGSGFFFRDNAVDFNFALRRLLAACRPRTALQVCHFHLAKVDTLLLADMLE